MNPPPGVNKVGKLESTHCFFVLRLLYNVPKLLLLLFSLLNDSRFRGTCSARLLSDNRLFPTLAAGFCSLVRMYILFTLSSLQPLV